MKELVEFRIRMEYAHLLFRDDEGTNLGKTVKVIRIDKNDPRFNAIGELQKKARDKFDFFFTCFEYKRSCSTSLNSNTTGIEEIRSKRSELSGHNIYYSREIYECTTNV